MHYRKIWELAYGPIPKDKNGISYEIHHLDGNRTNNSLENLVCLSVEDHLKIHLHQGDYGACFRILTRMDSENLLTKSECARNLQNQLAAEGRHNFQVYSERREQAFKRMMEKRLKIHGQAVLGIEDRAENSRRAGIASAKKQAGFLDTRSDNHGSKHVIGTKWWTNTKTGARMRRATCPGEDWKQGMKK